jgi:hypothetical protein
MLVIVHSGQTGVERGAHEGAHSSGLSVAGFMNRNRRDELGPIPDEIAVKLTAHHSAGSRAALCANLLTASGLLVVAPDARRPQGIPALVWIVKAARRMNLPLLVCDARTPLDDIASWTRTLQADNGTQRLVVTGPRWSRWTDGDSVARRLVKALAAV